MQRAARVLTIKSITIRSLTCCTSGVCVLQVCAPILNTLSARLSRNQLLLQELEREKAALLAAAEMQKLEGKVADPPHTNIPIKGLPVSATATSAIDTEVDISDSGGSAGEHSSSEDVPSPEMGAPPMMRATSGRITVPAGAVPVGTVPGTSKSSSGTMVTRKDWAVGVGGNHQDGMAGNPFFDPATITTADTGSGIAEQGLGASSLDSEATKHPGALHNAASSGVSTNRGQDTIRARSSEHVHGRAPRSAGGRGQGSTTRGQNNTGARSNSDRRPHMGPNGDSHHSSSREEHPSDPQYAPSGGHGMPPDERTALRGQSSARGEQAHPARGHSSETAGKTNPFFE